MPAAEIGNHQGCQTLAGEGRIGWRREHGTARIGSEHAQPVRGVPAIDDVGAVAGDYDPSIGGAGDAVGNGDAEIAKQPPRSGPAGAVVEIVVAIGDEIRVGAPTVAIES